MQQQTSCLATTNELVNSLEKILWESKIGGPLGVRGVRMRTPGVRKIVGPLKADI